MKIKFQNFSSIHLTFNHFEQLSIQEQLTIITQTDIFIGMHGAGLTHVIFMKSNRILIELTAIQWQRQKHFEQLASMNNINYHHCLIQNGHSTTTETIFNCITKKNFFSTV
jgi:capsular polysaccharide biosynthesis protein